MAKAIIRQRHRTIASDAIALGDERIKLTNGIVPDESTDWDAAERRERIEPIAQAVADAEQRGRQESDSRPRPVKKSRRNVPKSSHHNRILEFQHGRFGTYYKCPVEGCDVNASYSAHDKAFHISTQPDRNARKLAHAAFDCMWKSGAVSRSQAYKSLAEHMGMTSEKCHIGHFSVDECNRVIAFVQNNYTADVRLGGSIRISQSD